MISEKKVVSMTKLQAFEDREGKRVFPVVQFFRPDYISLQLLKAFLSFTVAAILVLVLWGCFHMEELLENINTMDYAAFIKSVLAKYVVALMIYLSGVYIYCSIRYTQARKKGRKYHRRLREVSKL